jgi:hypothetical protein
MESKCLATVSGHPAPGSDGFEVVAKYGGRVLDIESVEIDLTLVDTVRRSVHRNVASRMTVPRRRQYLDVDVMSAPKARLDDFRSNNRISANQIWDQR